jgi:hypothetical protein
MKATPLPLSGHGAGVTDSTAAAGPGAAVATPTVVEPETVPTTSTSAANGEGDWLCAWCHNHVAREKDRFRYNGKDEFSFTSPEGIRFAIITFSRTVGCREAGTPTLEHTWFPGYAWSFCQCDRCGQQLGWCYAGHLHFVGLIRDRIVRALLVNN